MESGTAVLETLSHPEVSQGANSPFKSECLPTALELLSVLRQEAEILGRFAGAELLELVPKKEYLVNELEWKLKSAGETQADLIRASGSLKVLLDEISKLNTSNGIFIQESLSYWQDFLSIFLPSSYGPTGVAVKPPALAHKGTAFSREV